MDKMERFLKENQENLENLDSFDKQMIWMEILQEQNRKKLIRRYVWPVAAGIVLALGLGFYSIYTTQNHETDMNWAGISPDLVDQLETLQHRLSQETAKIDFASLEQDTYGQVLQEISELDSMKEMANQDIPQFGPEEDIVRILIRHYEKKLRLLEILKKEIEKQQYENIIDNS